MLRKIFYLAALIIIIFNFNSQAAAQGRLEPQAAINILPKKNINKKLLGINAFANDQRFGSISSQFREVRNILGLKYVRVLFNWNDQVQPNPASPPFFGFYDEIAASLPANVQALVIINGLPSWMDSPSNWVNGNPRETFVKLWLDKVVRRYANNKRIKAWQVWNEPDSGSDPENVLLGLADNPENYLEMLAAAINIIREVTPRKKIVTAATTSINQKYPDTLNYNKALQAAGIENFIDVWAIHIYSYNIEYFLLLNDLPNFIKGLGKPIWVTESGEKGTLKQKDYAQRMWPFLFSLTSKIKRIYIYQFTEDAPASITYGLRNLTPGMFLSDLYIYLRDQVKAKRR